MAYQFLRGNTEDNNSYTGPLASITIDTEAGNIRVHDGVTEGGFLRIEDIDSIQLIIDSLQDSLDEKAALSGGVDANFDLMPQVEGDSIVSSGANSNGSWIQYSSGYQIVAQRGLVTGGSTWTFPQPFDTVDNLSISVTSSSSSPRFTGHETPTTTGVTLLAFLPDESSSAATLSSFATGFYK